MHDTVEHSSDEGKSNQERCGATVGESLAGVDKETSTDGATDGDHLQMTSLELAGQRRGGSALRGGLDVVLMARGGSFTVGEVGLCGSEGVLEGLPAAGRGDCGLAVGA